MINDEYEDEEDIDQEDESDSSESDQMEQVERENELKEQAAQERAIKREIKRKNPNSIKNRVIKAGWDKVKNAAKEFIKKNPKVILFIVIAIVVIAILACILYVILNKTDGDIVAAPDNFVSILPVNNPLRVEYETTNSLINYELSKELTEPLDETHTVTIDSIYDMFINQKDPKEYMQLLKDMQKKYNDGADNITEKKPFEIFDSEPCIDGTTICIDTSRGAISPNEDRELYKHILMTDKYNFNAIKWHSYSGKHSTGEVVDEKYLDATNSSQIKVNKETGIQYPNDSKMSETDFTRGFLRYLQNWSIPLAMYDGSIKSGEAGFLQNGDFAYQIVANAMSDVEINKYRVENREQILERIELTRAEVSKEFCDEITGENCHTVYRTISLSTERGPNEINDIVDTIYQYRLSDAKTFDINIHNSYSYRPYNENDEPMDTYTNKEDYSESYNEDGWSGTAYGKRYEIHNFWWDRLDLINTDTEYLTKPFVKSYSGGSYSDNEEKYYSNYEKKEQIDRVMLINSKKDIYTKYMAEEDAFDEHIGYTKYSLDNSYLQLRKKLTNLAGQYVYGHSLGIDTTNSADAIIDIGGHIPVQIPEGGIAWPVPESYTVGQLYGNTAAYGGEHKGIDITNANMLSTLPNGLTVGPKIIAVADGTVTVAKSNISRNGSLGNKDNDGAGNYVRIKLDNSIYTVIYMHLSQVSVKVNDKVKAGDIIGTMGTTGNSTGVHLHYQIEYGSRITVDPLLFYNTSPEYGRYANRYLTPSGYYKFESSKSGVTNQ